MSYKILIRNQKQWKKDLDTLDTKQRKKLISQILELKENPFKSANVKNLQHYHLADFRLRVNNYRVLFMIKSEKKEIILLRCLHRSKLY